MTATEEIHEEPGQIHVRPKTLYQKLLDIQRQIGVVEKDSRNQFHKYDYASIESVVGATHDPLADAGIVVLGGVNTLTDVTRNTREGESIVTTIELVFTLIDTETGERLDIPWAGRGDDPADKGVSKALTDARKTFLIQQLNLRRGDDTEADDATDQRSAPNGSRNLIAEARGLTNEQLNRVLVHIGMPAQQAPFGAFSRIPAESEGQARAALKKLHEGA
jgi:hypothetical protein